MSPISEIDQILAGIAKPLVHEADTLLDLREAAAHSPHPGRCVSCYFKLLASVPHGTSPNLTSLRHWLESRIEIAATGEQGDLLEVLPLDLAETEDLESCCRRAMDLFLEDRSYAHTNEIGLCFRFRPEEAA